MWEKNGHTYWTAKEIAKKSGWSLVHVRRHLKENLASNEKPLVKDRTKYYHNEHMINLKHDRVLYELRQEQLAKESEKSETPEASEGSSEWEDLKERITHLEQKINELKEKIKGSFVKTEDRIQQLEKKMRSLQNDKIS